MSTAVEIEDLYFAYTAGSGNETLLRNISLIVQKGELVAIQGPSGSGKSTLLYLIAGLLQGYRGRIRILGRDVSSLSDLERAQLRNSSIGFIFQQFYLLPRASVLENISLPSQYPVESPRRPDQKRIEEVASQVGMSEFLERFPSQLSGGQQQRTAIARAILNDPDIILADEPTGSLDSANAQSILSILKDLSQRGKTVLIITHDPEIARSCDRIIHIKDGELEFSESPLAASRSEEMSKQTLTKVNSLSWIYGITAHALRALRQNQARAFLNMFGIIVGVAAVLSMVTVGSFTKKKILESYADIGANTIVFQGNENWDLTARESVGPQFSGFDLKKDFEPLQRIFPEVEMMSPVLNTWATTKATYAGKAIEDGVRTIGMGSNGLQIQNRELLFGNYINPYHVESRSPVCVIGFEIFQRLFSNSDPIGKILFLQEEQITYGCRVIGVLKSISSNDEWSKPNMTVNMPFTYFKTVTSNKWQSLIRMILIKVRMGADIQKTGDSIKHYFEHRYGKSGYFFVGMDSLLLSQMNKFLSLFSLLLGIVALVSLFVGGLGITNMMLVSLSERLREIGIRKAFGATDRSIRYQYLSEALFLCLIAGAIGLVAGFALYQAGIWTASKVISKVAFEWVFNMPAILISFVSIIAVGVCSGLIPAIRAERLSVIEALRSD